MYCLKCKKKHYSKRGFLELLEVKKKYICDHCLDEYPITPKLHEIDLDNGSIKVISMFDKNFSIDLNPYVLQINQIYNFFRKKYKKYTIILLDYLSLTYFNLEILSFWKECFNDVIIICGILRK